MLEEGVRGWPAEHPFDFFDTAGLKLVGDWTASKPPIRKKEPAFPNSRSWSSRGRGHLERPAPGPPGHRPGRRPCAARRASRSATRSLQDPGQWTLPEVTLTVAARRGRGRRRTAAGPGAAREPARATGGGDLGAPRRDRVPRRPGQRGGAEGGAGPDPLLALLGGGRAWSPGHALRLADGPDHGQLLRQAGAAREGEDDRPGDHLLPGDHRHLHLVGVLFSFFFGAAS